jgi:hypothetical protein
MRSLKIVARFLLFIVHIAQGVISISGSFWISAFIASVLVGSHLYKTDEFRKLFRVSPWLASLFGSFLWFGVILIEIGLE